MLLIQQGEQKHHAMKSCRAMETVSSPQTGATWQATFGAGLLYGLKKLEPLVHSQMDMQERLEWLCKGLLPSITNSNLLFPCCEKFQHVIKFFFWCEMKFRHFEISFFSTKKAYQQEAKRLPKERHLTDKIFFFFESSCLCTAESLLKSCFYRTLVLMNLCFQVKLLHWKILASWNADLCKVRASKCVEKAYCMCLDQGFQWQPRWNTPDTQQQGKRFEMWKAVVTERRWIILLFN